IGTSNFGFHQMWLGVLVCTLYILSMVGSCIILCILRVDRHLHQPMYFFLCMMSLNNLEVSLSTLLAVLTTFCFDCRGAGCSTCSAQMFFIHCLSLTWGCCWPYPSNGVIAIRTPLHYTSARTGTRILGIGLAAAVRGFGVLSPLAFLLRHLPFCRDKVLSHPYCLHPDIMKLACADISLHILYGLCAVIVVFGIDSLLLSSSMLRFGRPPSVPHLKGSISKPCVSYVSAVPRPCVPTVAVSTVHCFGEDLPLLLMSSICLSVPPVLNSLVYSVNNKDI
ncbi:PREDICTED: olfactory receptor 51I2-like, partial [Phaethon lepturus]|uniref:olfactory receptor 51I2-like n=1 Tax=Phaethon lepturus TaxID=97097 RepID=UPI0005308C37